MVNQEESLMAALTNLSGGGTDAPTPAISVDHSVADTAEFLTESAQQMLLDNTNSIVFLGLSQPRPNVVEYVTQQLNKHEAENITEMSTKGQVMPILVPEKFSYPFDGYGFIKNGEHVWVKKKDIIDWMLENTLGFISGDETGRAIEIKAKKSLSASENTKSSPLIVSRKKISLNNKENFIETFEIDTTLPPVSKTFQLVGDKEDIGGKQKSPRGKVDNYPQFKRKDDVEYDALGDLTSKPKKGKKIRKGDLDTFLNDYSKFLALNKKFKQESVAQ